MTLRFVFTFTALHLITSFVYVLHLTGHGRSHRSSAHFVFGEASAGRQVRFVKHGACLLRSRASWKGARDSNVETASTSAENTTSFGLTETSAATHCTPFEGETKSGSVGLLLPNMECKVINPDTEEILGPNQDGEICVKGPMVMKEATAKTIDSDGWLHTGDIGHYDEDEYFFIVDRLKELIKYKGFQVPPAELEALLISHPNIDDVAVIGVPDLESGELPKAFVVRRGDVTSEAIMEFVAKRVVPQKS
ncbi:hypothetical protein OS493_012523 [Desmophyllum pertusum]|uniref:Uncharacterized protein n=1 Tax=Desmophyllum pertusum TaxID=174260 RepID=A0A9W9ZDW1_9CNID|nr:hypothetical protein OS493_012523 [Desmophyllum pertusum]